MKSFLIKSIYFITIPFVVILGIYIITDPFKIIKPFSFDYVTDINREYASMEIFRKNNSVQKYDSFVFGSSKACFINTYQWISFLPEGSNQFLFQAWAETITGIHQKIKYLDDSDVVIKNALILIDIPGSFFLDGQNSRQVLTMHHYELSGSSKFDYHFIFFNAYFKPSKIFSSLFGTGYYDTPFIYSGIDTISNDCNCENKFAVQYDIQQDSTFSKAKSPAVESMEAISEKLIIADFQQLFIEIQHIFSKNDTQYKIVITPDSQKTHINDEDLQFLQTIFGINNVYNYSGENYITSDKNNFNDAKHFNDNVGRLIINDIYLKSGFSNIY